MGKEILIKIKQEIIEVFFLKYSGSLEKKRLSKYSEHIQPKDPLRYLKVVMLLILIWGQRWPAQKINTFPFRVLLHILLTIHNFAISNRCIATHFICKDEEKRQKKRRRSEVVAGCGKVTLRSNRVTYLFMAYRLADIEFAYPLEHLQLETA